MKKRGNILKYFFIGLLSFIGFFIFNNYFLSPIGRSLIVGGSSFEISYHSVSYSGIAGLSAVIIICTCIIVNKINELIKELNKHEKKD